MQININVMATFHKLADGKIRAVVTLTGDTGHGRSGAPELIVRTYDAATAEQALAWATGFAFDKVVVPEYLIHS